MERRKQDRATLGALPTLSVQPRDSTCKAVRTLIQSYKDCHADVRPPVDAADVRGGGWLSR
jgi:hypothetical protein